MISAYTLIWLLVAHYVGDFVLQTQWMATNKSKNSRILATHVAVYSCTLAIFVLPLFGMKAILFAGANGVLHFITDYISSRMSGKYYREGNISAFWKVIGLDQLAHYVALILLLTQFS